jgi:CheY-like chemotaxis protein
MSPPPVLYVEDDDDLRCVLKQQLTRAGFAVTAVCCAEDALSLLQTRKFGALLTDYQLPGHNAAWLLAEASARGLIEQRAVVVLSADRKPAGIEGYTFLRKPADIAVIVEALRTAGSRVAMVRSCIVRSQTLIRIVAHGITRFDERVSAWAFPAPWRAPVMA